LGFWDANRAKRFGRNNIARESGWNRVPDAIQTIGTGLKNFENPHLDPPASGSYRGYRQT
jgi:hypothetical protein